MNKMDELSLLKGLSFKSKKGKTWIFGDLINEGSFGKIYTTFFNKENLIKIGKESVFYEIAVLRKIAPDSKVQTPVIPKVIDSGKIFSLGLDNTYFIIMPNYGNSLHSMLIDNTLSIQELNLMMSSMLFALSYLSSKKYMHLDINPKNIILDKITNNWYLIDYGLAKNFRNNKFEKDKKSVDHGTPLYTARDAHEGILSRKCDLESLIYTMLVAENILLPWEGIENKKKLFIQKTQFFKEDVYILEIPKNQRLFIIAVDNLTPIDNPNYQGYQELFISKMNKSQKTRLKID